MAGMVGDLTDCVQQNCTVSPINKHYAAGWLTQWMEGALANQKFQVDYRTQTGSFYLPAIAGWTGVEWSGV